jgi:hypothetical protein
LTELNEHQAEPPSAPTKLKELHDTREERELVARLKSTLSEIDSLLETARFVREKYGLGSLDHFKQHPFSLVGGSSEIDPIPETKTVTMSKLEKLRPSLEKVRALPYTPIPEKNTIGHKRDFMKRCQTHPETKQSNAKDIYIASASLFIFMRLFLTHTKQMAELSENGSNLPFQLLISSTGNSLMILCQMYHHQQLLQQQYSQIVQGLREVEGSACEY